MSPNMLTTCMNDQADDPTARPIPTANPQYSPFCYTFQYMPGVTTYLDTPVVPVAAFTGPDQFPLDCEYPDGTPRIYSATNVRRRGSLVHRRRNDAAATTSPSPRWGWSTFPTPSTQGGRGPPTVAEDPSPATTVSAARARSDRDHQRHRLQTEPSSVDTGRQRSRHSSPARVSGGAAAASSSSPATTTRWHRSTRSPSRAVCATESNLRSPCRADYADHPGGHRRGQEQRSHPGRPRDLQRDGHHVEAGPAPGLG